MGMALRTTQERSEMPRDYQRMSIKDLRELARASHEEHTPEAAREFVARALDMEVERRTVLRHDNLGWHTHSPMAPGFAPGGTDIAREPLAHIADRWRGTHAAHEYVRRWIELARLPQRQLLAALIQARKLHGNGDQGGAGKDWVKGYDHIAEHIHHYAHLLGFDAGPAGYSFACIADQDRQPNLPPAHERVTVPRDARERRILAERAESAQQGPTKRRQRHQHQVPAYPSGKAIIDAARRARAELILLAQV